MNVEQIHIEYVAEDGATVPEKAHADDAAFDLRAYLPHLERGVDILHGETLVIPTGIRIALPAGVAAFVLPRSGLAAKNGITVLNSPGLIDPGYRGDIGVILHNTAMSDFTVRHGDRIAQLLTFRLTPASFYPVTFFIPAEEAAGRESGERGEGGFGSTGL